MVYISAYDKGLIMMGDTGKAITKIGNKTSSLGPEGAPSMAMDHAAY